VGDWPEREAFIGLLERALLADGAAAQARVVY
jgi:hypothetical protein